MTAATDCLTTPLYDLHLKLGGKMVSFAGYSLPVQYTGNSGGIIKEHLHVREAAGLFDVSHMGQITVTGEQAAQALESLMPVDVLGLAPGQQRYGLLTNENGGIMDDLMVSNQSDHYLLVVNAACKHADFAYIKSQISDRCEVKQLDNKALLALQGPKSAQVMASLGGGVGSMGDWFFMQSAVITLAGVEVLASRAGYTGEDGFEISVQESDALPLAQALLGHEDVLPIGLGARDSLRLEAGLCLYGHDIDTHTTPIEAGLNWAISRVRRKNGARAGGFPGADKILDQLESGVSQKRVGLKPVGRAPLREGVLLVDSEGNNIGKISSGGFGPSIEAPVAMAYLNSQLCDAGTTVFASVRGKTVAAEVAKLPFVAHNYCRGHSS